MPDVDLQHFLQIFRREEQNFVTQNEIDNLALIMPSQAKRLSPSKVDQKGGQKGSAIDKLKKKEKKKLESHNSLNVACLKRLLPIGLTVFGGKEQELVQQAKQKLFQVSICHLSPSLCFLR